LDRFGWLLGAGETRGIALIFLISGVVMVAVSALAFTTKTYRHVSAAYGNA